MGVFLRQLDGTVVSIRKKRPICYIPCFKIICKSELQPRPDAPPPKKKWKSPISRSKGVFCEHFFLLFQKLYLTLLAKNQVPICLLSLSKFNIEYIAEISKKAITQQKNENSKI